MRRSRSVRYSLWGATSALLATVSLGGCAASKVNTELAAGSKYKITVLGPTQSESFVLPAQVAHNITLQCDKCK